MATPTIPNGKVYFNVVNYNGTGSDNAVTGVGFAPDATWLKRRDSGLADWGVFDTSRGVTKNLKFNKTDAESTDVNSLKTFGTDGFTVGSSSDYNGSGGTFSSFNFLANGGTTASNTDGSITSTVQSNSDAGFSIVQYTGTGSAATVGHGLSTPEWIFGRPVTQTGGYNWSVYHKSLTSASYYLSLNSTHAQTSNSNVWGSAPTSSVINIGTSMSASSEPMILYCWHGVDGFSKFGSYSGNGSTDGQFIYTGFKVSWLLIKRTDSSTGGNWSMINDVTYPSNPIGSPLMTDYAGGESDLSAITMDFLSNGFKIRNTLNSNNASGGSYIFCAFASNPFVGDGTSPVTAR
nr:hypothetical protein [uncultured Mediterranean phage uvMED]